MGLTSWLSRIFFPETKTIRVSDYAGIDTAVALEEMAIFTCVNLLADIVSKCTFKTYADHQPTKGEEWYSWNYAPNRNQNSTQFIQELVAKLLLYNEVLIIDIGGSKLVADSYNHVERAVDSDIFSDVCCNNFVSYKTFVASDVLFLRLNNADIKRAMCSLFDMYSRATTEAFDKYQKSGGKSGTLHISGVARGAPTFNSDIDTLMNDRFKRFFSAKNAVLPLFDGYKYEPVSTESSKKTTNEVSDIRSLTEQAMERAANAFKIAPQLLRGDVTNIDDAINLTLTLAVDPIVKQLETEINRKRYGQKALSSGTYLSIDSTCIKHIDIFDVATDADKLIAAGLYSTNELRRKIGEEAIDAKWANEYQRTKNYENADTARGGENN